MIHKEKKIVFGYLEWMNKWMNELKENEWTKIYHNLKRNAYKPTKKKKEKNHEKEQNNTVRIVMFQAEHYTGYYYRGEKTQFQTNPKRIPL